ncbi:lipoprotein [Sporomusaceae bacterium FL31]|nr:lipoprotein [Sporomusaceae bacterium FL31]GCE35844.1 lipoprotein [Sporomusaceae bacterium]
MMKSSPKMVVGIIILIGLAGWAFMRLGAGGKTASGPSMQGGAVEVKAMRVVQQDMSINYEFAGKVTAKDEIKIISKVSGNIVAKMVQGGDAVYKGQSLFKIDNKQHLSSINSARATLTKSQATLRNIQRDVARYRSLAANGAIAQQTLDSYEARAEEEAASVEANRASLQQAIEDEQDTLIVSPVDGRIDVNDISMGQFVTAGTTTMGTVSSVDPVWVQFSMSETEYIKFARMGGGTLPDTFKENLKLIVSDGSEYNLTGRVEQIDRGIGDITGTITLKALFDNPQNFLLPGMFAKIVVPGEFRKAAILIPQRAVTELLDETFVTMVTADNKAEIRKVNIAEKVGNLYVVAEGLAAGDCVVVEGLDKVKKDTALQVTLLVPENLPVPASNRGND